MCLLVSEMSNLKDGKVFVEILKHFLLREGMINGFIRDINSSDKMSPVQKVLFVIEVMSRVDNNKLIRKKFEKFYNNHLRLLKDDDFLLDFVALLRIIFEKEIENDIEEDQPKELIHNNNNDVISVQSGTFGNNRNYSNNDYDNENDNDSNLRLQKEKGIKNKYYHNEVNAMYNDNYNEYCNQNDIKQVNEYNCDEIVNVDEYNQNEQHEQNDNDDEYYINNFNQKAIKNNQMKTDFTKMNKHQSNNSNEIIQSNYQNQMKELNYNPSYRNDRNRQDYNYHPQNHPYNTNYILSTQNQINTHCNTAFTPHPTLHQMEITQNDHFDFHPQIKTEKKSPQLNPPQIQNQQQRQITPVKKKQANMSIYNHNSNLNDFDISMISKKYSHEGGISSSDASFYTQIETNKLYSKRKRAEINLSRGIQFQNKLFKLEHKNITIPYLKLSLPTQLITVVSFNEMIKFQVITSTVNNLHSHNKLTAINTPKEQNLNCTDNSALYVPKPKNHQDNIPQSILSCKSTRNKNRDKISIASISMIQDDRTVVNQNESSLRQNLNAINSINNNTNVLPQMNIQSNNNISIPTKNKIYSWLIDVGILKDKAIGINELSNICINGVLLCDLINRCEGRNECIHGIIRKTTTKSQIQVNVNKVLVHLRSIEKFSSRHLWSHNEILQGQSQTIWELLEDLYNFYSIKTKFVSRSKSKPKLLPIQNSNPEKDVIGQDPLINFNLNEVMPFENNHYPTPLHSHNNTHTHTHTNNSQMPLRNPPIQTVMPQREMARIQSYNQLRKPNKNTSMTRCNTNNNISTLTANNKQNKSNSFIQKQKHNQSFQSHLPTSNNISGFLLFEKSTVKKLRQNIDQISGLNTTYS